MAPRKKRRFDDAFFGQPRTTVLRLPPLREQLSASLHLGGAGTLFVAGQ